ncbi:ISLR protein, partial [Ptilonorhynchus violaceus]|nr:ISLR protein [Ptilonorhynchus violaceus]
CVALLAALLAPSVACPAPCSCSPKRNGRLLAECAYRDLLAVPRGLPANVTILTLSANSLARLPRGSLSDVPELQSLWLGYNRLASVEPGALAAVPLLKNLDLSHNRLEDFPWKDLRNLSELQILKLDHNRLEKLPRDAFAELRELRSLWLNDNALGTVARGTFEELPALGQLQLFRNPLECSCKLFWLARWAREGAVGGVGSTLCAAPESLRGRPVTAIPARACVEPTAQLTYLSAPSGAPLAHGGLTLALHCSVAGVPAPEIRWRVRTAGGKSVDIPGEENGERFLTFRNGTMAVPGFGKEDEGTYTCVAVNDVGSREASVHVALAGSGHPGEELPRDDPHAGNSGNGEGRSCSKGSEADPSGIGEKVVIVYRVAKEARSAAGGMRIPPGMLLLALGLAMG